MRPSGLFFIGGGHMIQSSIKPAEIQIISTQDDIRNNKVNVKYAFNYAITEKQVEETLFDEETGEETTKLVTVYEYYQYISEASFDLLVKPLIPELLKNIYKQLETTILDRLNLANTELPKEITLGG